jgi:non-specific serine/threonine protein kinase
MVASTSLPERYQVLQLIARGGCGAVYQAVDLETGQPVAVKQVTAAAGDAGLAQALRREAETLRNLRHARLPAFVDYIPTAEDHFLVMTYVAGEDLGHQLERRTTPFPVDQVMAWADQLLETLAYLHGQKPPVIHRDIKPANLKLNEQGQVMLLDFGLARGGTSTLHTLPGYTLSYAPPEQLLGDPSDARSDLYSVGATLYHLLTGVKPTDALRRKGALLDGQPDPLEPAYRRHTLVSAALSDVLQCAMALAAEQRFGSTLDMQQALRAALAEPATRIVVQPHLAQQVLNNLPAAITPLIGRETETVAMQALLCRADVRLATLIGVGGVGKTRLALQVAGRLLPSFPQGVFFVPLIEASRAEHVLNVLARVLEVRQEPGQSLLETVVDRIAQGRRLLILDNFEHVLTSAPLATTLLAAAPDLKILVTSRERLHVTGEHLWRVPALPLPPANAPLTPADIAAFPAIALFQARAKAVWPAFSLDGNQAQAVAELCRHLDGLPLAIELAAARVDRLSPAAMLAQLDRRFAWLSQGPRDAHPRQQSMLATIDWTYALLEEPAQILWRWASPFVAGLTAEAVAAIVEHNPALPAQADEAVQMLLDNSILQHTPGAAGEPRYTMLETLRSFGQERLAQHGESELAARAMAAYYLDLAARAAPELVRPAAKDWLRRLDGEHPNVRVVLRWAITSREIDTALRLCLDLWRYWRARGLLHEGRRWFRQALADAEAGSPALRAKALNKAGVLAYEQGDVAEAQALEEQALAMQRSAGDRWGVVSTLNMLGVLAMDRAQYDEADRWLTEALALAQEVGHAVNGAHALNNLGLTAIRRGRIRLAVQRFEQSLAAFESLGDRRSMALLRGNLGEALHLFGQPQRALAILADGRAEWHALGDRWGEAANAIEQAGVLLDLGEFDRAEALWRDAEGIMRQIGSEHMVVRCQCGLGVLSLRCGNVDEARRLLSECRQFYEQIDDGRVLSYVVGDLSDLALAGGDLAQADSLSQHALELAEQTGDLRSYALRLGQRADLALLAGDWPKAEQHGQEALALHRQTEHTAGLAAAQRTLAQVANGQGQLELAHAYALASLRTFWRLGYRFDMALGLEVAADISRVLEGEEVTARLLGAAEGLRRSLGAPRLQHPSTRQANGEPRAQTSVQAAHSFMLPTERAGQDLAELLAQVEAKVAAYG